MNKTHDISSWEGSEGIKSVFVDQMNGARRTFGVRLAENVEFPR